MTSKCAKVLLDLLPHIRFFDDASAPFIAALDEQSVVIRCSKGKILFSNGDLATRFFFVKSGLVKIFRETAGGMQAVLNVLGHNQIFGETALFQDMYYPYSAEVMETSEIISLPLFLLKKEMQDNTKMAMAMASLLAERQSQQDLELEHRTLQNAPQRIGCYLLNLADKNAEGKVVIDLPYDKTLLSARLGMQPETFSRAFSKLKEATGIRATSSKIELHDVKALVAFCCSACSTEFSVCKK